MQLDVDIEPTFRFSYMKCIDKQKDIFHPNFKVLAPLTYRRKVTHQSPPCKLHRWDQKLFVDLENDWKGLVK